MQASWQSLLLSVLSQMRYVMNPLSPQSIGITAFQVPYILQSAQQVGLLVPSYTLLPRCSSVMLSSLWYFPQSQEHSQLRIESPKGAFIIVSFVRVPQGYRFWPEVPLVIKAQLESLCKKLRLDVGEAYFYVEKNWVFYSIRPGFSQESNEQVLEEVALCIKELGDRINAPAL